MITASSLHRLILAIWEEHCHQAGHVDEGPDVDTARRMVTAELATRYDLDIQDTATLYRVASGEASAHDRDPRPTVAYYFDERHADDIRRIAEQIINGVTP